MLRRRANAPASLLLCAIGVTVCFGCSQDAGRGSQRDEEPGKPPDQRAQIATAASMRAIVEMIALHEEDYGELPHDLDTLYERHEILTEIRFDGWGRRIHYYTNGKDYILASFGRHGKPGGQVAAPGGIVQEQNYDVDFVWINDAWAQTPYGIE